MKRSKLTVYAIGISICISTICILTFLYLYFYLYVNKNRNINNNTNNRPSYGAPVLGHAAASVDSERQFAPDEQWRGQRSKCLDCEQDMKQRCGNRAVFNATKQKLFSV